MKNVQLPIGCRVSFPSAMRNNRYRTIFGTVIEYTPCPFTGKLGAVIKCDGEIRPRILPVSYLKECRVN
jgi:hypothetical protein